MLACKTRANATFLDHSLRTISFMQMGAGQTATAELYLFNQPDYREPQQLNAIPNQRSARGVNSMQLTCIPLTSNASWLLQNGFVRGRCDTLLGDGSAYSTLRREDGISGAFQALSSPLLVGGLAVAYPVDGETLDEYGFPVIDTDESVRLDLQVAIPEDFSSTGKAAWAIRPLTAESVTMENAAICDLAMSDVTVCEGPDVYEPVTADLNGALIVEVTILSKALQAAYASVGITIG